MNLKPFFEPKKSYSNFSFYWIVSLSLCLEGDVAAEHVVQQDAERPHRRRVPAVPAEPDPLGRGVDQGACRKSWLCQLSWFGDFKGNANWLFATILRNFNMAIEILFFSIRIMIWVHIRRLHEYRSSTSPDSVYKYVQKSRSKGYMIPRCNLQCGVTQPILRLFWHIVVY